MGCRNQDIVLITPTIPYTIPYYTMHFILPLSFLIISLQGIAGQCDGGAYVYKSHTWNKGYVAKLYLDQSWLAQQTSDWKLSLTFANQVAEFKVWDADIINPTTKNNYVMEVSSVEIMNKCYNPILYSCQYLELSFMVRFPEGVSDEMSTDYDIIAVTQDITYNDGATGSNTYCMPLAGQPTTPATP